MDGYSLGLQQSVFINLIKQHLVMRHPAACMKLYMAV